MEWKGFNFVPVCLVWWTALSKNAWPTIWKLKLKLWCSKSQNYIETRRKKAWNLSSIKDCNWIDYKWIERWSKYSVDYCLRFFGLCFARSKILNYIVSLYKNKSAAKALDTTLRGVMSNYFTASDWKNSSRK